MHRFINFLMISKLESYAFNSTTFESRFFLIISVFRFSVKFISNCHLKIIFFAQSLRDHFKIIKEGDKFILRLTWGPTEDKKMQDFPPILSSQFRLSFKYQIFRTIRDEYFSRYRETSLRLVLYGYSERTKL